MNKHPRPNCCEAFLTVADIADAMSWSNHYTRQRLAHYGIRPLEGGRRNGWNYYDYSAIDRLRMAVYGTTDPEQLPILMSHINLTQIPRNNYMSARQIATHNHWSYSYTVRLLKRYRYVPVRREKHEKLYAREVAQRIRDAHLAHLAHLHKGGRRKHLVLNSKTIKTLMRAIRLAGTRPRISELEERDALPYVTRIKDEIRGFMEAHPAPTCGVNIRGELIFSKQAFEDLYAHFGLQNSFAETENPA
jgi:hypothetical protein